VDYKTVVLDNSANTATPGVDFVEKKGTLKFNHQETSKTIEIKIIQHDIKDSKDDD
jgi:hypothetical protein